MHISPITYNQKNNYYFNKNNVNFGNSIKTKNIGRLQKVTSEKLRDFLHAYNDIIAKLASKSQEGLEFISQNFPVTINDCLVFHNCGKDKDNIFINTQGEGIETLSHIARKKYDSTQWKYVTDEAYMVEDDSKLLSEFKTNYMRTFPKSRIYMTQEKIEEENLDKKIQQLLDDLEPQMLQLRIFLLINQDKFVKIPDGRAPFLAMDEIRKIKHCLNSVKENAEKIPPKQLHKLLYEDFKEYIPRKGNSTYSFKNLGEENVTITFGPVESQYHNNLNRLTVHNNDGTLKQVFLLQGDKIVKNTSLTNFTYIADNLEFYNEKEVLEPSVSGELLKYLKLYYYAASKLQAIVQKRASIIEAKKRAKEGVFTQNTTETFDKAFALYNDIYSLYSSANSHDKKAIKELFSKRKIKLAKGGIRFPAKENFKEIYYQPVNSSLHKNLTKFAITDTASETIDYYLIHNNKQIVKNFWANSPNIIPQKIMYLEEDNMPNLSKEIQDTCDLLTEIKELILDTLAKGAQKQREIRENAAMKRKETIAQKKEHCIQEQEEKNKLLSNPEFKNLSKYCKGQIVKALKNINDGIDDFNKALQDIQEKVSEFYKSNIQNPNK